MSAGQRDNFSGEETFTAPTGGVTKGKLYQIASGMIVVARETADAAATFLAGVEGVYDVTKATSTGVTFSKGGKVYWSSSTKTVTNASTGNTLIGFALESVAAAATDTVKIMLKQVV